MKAEEMFKKLGYMQLENSEVEIRYFLKKETWKKSIVFRKNLEDFYLSSSDWYANDYKTWTAMSKNNEFRDDFEKYCSKYGHWQSNIFSYLDAPLLQAINQQCKELGWIE